MAKGVGPPSDTHSFILSVSGSHACHVTDIQYIILNTITLSE